MQEDNLQEVEPSNFLIIIGAMKSGTTTLFDLLKQHPQIAESNQKEPEFFNNQESFEQGLDVYRNLWKWNPGVHKCAMEASTAYAKHPFEQDVAKRMSSWKNCTFKFVYIVRNPYERIESNTRHGLYKGWNSSLDSGLTTDSYAVALSKYAMQIDQYLEYFDRSSLLILTLDELKEDPESVLRKVSLHAGVDPEFSFNQVNKVSNLGRKFERPKWLNRIDFGTGVFSRSFKSILKKVLGDRRATKILHNSGMRIDRGRFQLSSDERKQVLDFLRDDLKRMQDEFDIDVGKLWDIHV